MSRIANNVTLKFLLVGVINTLVGSAVMFLLYNFAHTGYWIATASNYIVGSLVSYLLNKRFTFQYKGKTLATLIRFTANIVICYFIAYGLAQPCVNYVFGNFGIIARENIAMLAGMFFFVALNYIGQRFFVFPNREDQTNASKPEDDRMKSQNKQLKKVMFISSTGGHFRELMKLSPLFDAYDYTIVTEKTEASYSELKAQYGDKVHFLLFGTGISPVVYVLKLGINTILSLFLFLKIRPQFIVTTGAHTAGPICLIGKKLGAKIIFIETFANISTMSGAGRRIYKFADLFVVQHEEMLELYPDAKYVGGLF
jgi:putative flippase GtrA